MKTKQAFVSSALALLMTGSAASAATTVQVENGSTLPLRLAVEQWPEGQRMGLSAIVGAKGSTATRKPGSKVLIENENANQHLVSIVYLNSKGEGCRFRTTLVRHSPAMARIVPVAETLGSLRCKAETGPTIGDFVFWVR